MYFYSIQSKSTQIMVAVAGTYNNGVITLDKDYASLRPIKVIVTFLDDEVLEINSTKGLQLSDFSFAKSQQSLMHYKGSFSQAVVEERNASK